VALVAFEIAGRKGRGKGRFSNQATGYILESYNQYTPIIGDNSLLQSSEFVVSTNLLDIIYSKKDTEVCCMLQFNLLPVAPKLPSSL
jgi:hypothetical protein